MTAKKVLAALTLALIGGGVWFWTAYQSNHQGALVLSGNVDIRLVDASFQVEGRLQDMLVEEGDKVVRGQILARVDDAYLNDQVALVRARVAAQQAATDKLVSGSRAEEIAQARARVAERRAAVANARATFKRQDELARRDVASQQRRDDAEAALKQAEAQLAQDQEALDLALSGPREEDLRAAFAQLEGERALLTLAERRLSDAELAAPADGVVQTRVREPGAMVASGTVVYTIALSSPVWVRAYVGEPDLGRAVPGTAVEVRTDSAPDQVYAGQIGFVSPVAEFTPKSVETPNLRTSLVYRLRIVVENPDDGLRQGMPVTVTLPVTLATRP